MSAFVVYSALGSPFGRAVLATLEEKGADYRLSPVAPGTFREQAHLSRHPFGRVPVLDHAGFVLYETQAILRYLDRVLPRPCLTPADVRAAARMDQVMNIADWYFFQGVNKVIGFQRVIAPRLYGRAADEAAIAACLPNAHAVLSQLERLLSDQPYFAGVDASLADIHMAAQMNLLAEAPEWSSLAAATPRIVDWLARMNARPSFKATTWERVEAMEKAHTRAYTGKA